MTNHPIFTIGHSNHSLEDFLALLSKHRVTAVADVRSAPWSRFNAHFNRNELAAALKARGIHYVYLGRELGGRPEDPALYDEDGRVRYERVARTSTFRAGVAQALDADGIEVVHILADGEIERHARTMDRQPKADSGRKPEEDMFPDALIEATTKNRSERIAFVRKNHVSDPERKDR